MMGRRSGQIGMQIVDVEMMIPQNHLLRKIDRMVRFEFIYELLAPYYPSNGRPSVDPVSMFKMLLVGYLYGIKSERRLVEEVRLNLAYRWFCGFELHEAIPDHSTFSKTRVRKWQQSDLFQKVFQEIVRHCVESGLVDGKALAADGSYLPANVSRESWVDVEVEVEHSMQSYLDRLDEELAAQPGFRKPPVKKVTKRRTTSTSDPDCGYINHGTKRGVGYLMEATVDCKHGIVTGIDVCPANQRESLLVLRHLERQIQSGIPMKRIALDRGYDTGAVHRGLELLGITGYIPAIQFPNTPEKYGFTYNPQQDAFVCPEGKLLTYHRLNCNQSTGKYLRCYQASCTDCSHCGRRKTCFETNSTRRRVLASSCYPAFFRGHSRVATPSYLSMMRLRKIWAEGSFSVLKREHCLSRIRKRGIPAVTEECLLSVMALNLKRMVKASFFSCFLRLSMCHVSRDLLWNDYFVNRSRAYRKTTDVVFAFKGIPCQMLNYKIAHECRKPVRKRFYGGLQKHNFIVQKVPLFFQLFVPLPVDLILSVPVGHCDLRRFVRQAAALDALAIGLRRHHAGNHFLGGHSFEVRQLVGEAVPLLNHFRVRLQQLFYTLAHLVPPICALTARISAACPTSLCSSAFITSSSCVPLAMMCRITTVPLLCP